MIPTLLPFIIAAMFALSPICHGAEPVRPNVVLIISDDMGYSDAGAFGCRDIKTPNIDRLAEAGTVFTDAYVAGPICVPSRMGIFFGRYPQRWGIYGHRDGHIPSGQKATAAQTTLVKPFQEAGYATALFGKWHVSGARSDTPPENRPERNGFDEVAVIHGGMASYWPGTPIYCGYGREEEAPEYLTDHFGKIAVNFIHRQKSGPFFLCLAFNAVHSPFQAVDADVQACGYVPRGPRRTYAGMMTALDRNVGRVLDALAAAGIEQNTIVAFVNDNGGPPQAPTNNLPLRGYKFDVLEGGIRTPMILKWPGNIPSGKKFSGLSSAMDLGATFLAAAGLSAPSGIALDGVNLLPFVNGRGNGEPHPMLFWECNWFPKPDCAVRRGQWKIVQLRTGPEGPVADKWQLFNLASDIGEAHDVAADHPEIVKELDLAFREWRSQMVDSCSHAARAAARDKIPAAKDYP